MLNFKAKELCNVLNGSNEEDFRNIGSISDSGREVTFYELKPLLKEAFEKELNVKLISDTPSKFELNLAKELEGKKYSASEWNFLR